MESTPQARWTKIVNKWLLSVEGDDILANGTQVRTVKRDGTAETHKAQHSKHCTCGGGAHLYFAQRGHLRTPRLYAATGGW